MKTSNAKYKKHFADFTANIDSGNTKLSEENLSTSSDLADGDLTCLGCYCWEMVPGLGPFFAACQYCFLQCLLVAGINPVNLEPMEDRWTRIVYFLTVDAMSGKGSNVLCFVALPQSQ